MGHAMVQKSRKLILGSTFFLPPRLPPPRPRPLPLPLPLNRLKEDFPCFISIKECNSSSQRMHPEYNVAPSAKGVLFLLKSTSMILESQSGQRSWVVEIRWAPWGRKTRQLHMLQWSLHLGALIGSRTRVPLHSGQAQTPWDIREWRHVGCGQREHGIPAPLPSLPGPPVLGAPKSASTFSNGGLL